MFKAYNNDKATADRVKNFLIEYNYTDETTADIIARGGSDGYWYGLGGWDIVDIDDEVVDQQRNNIIQDVSLELEDNEVMLIGSAY